MFTAIFRQSLASFAGLLVLVGCGAQQSEQPTSTVMTVTNDSVVWAPSAATCTKSSTSAGVRYNNCTGSYSAADAGEVSATDSAEIRAIGFKHYARISFTCATLGPTPAVASYKVGSQTGELGPNGKVEPTVDVDYGESGVSVSYAPKGTTVFAEGCRLVLEKSYRYIDPKAAKNYAKLLRENQKVLNELLPLVTPDTDTTTVVSNINGAIDAINEALDDYGDELDADTVKELKKSVADLTSSRGVVEGKCASGGQECQNAKAAARNLVTSYQQSGGARISALSDYLTKEIARLQSIDDAIYQKLDAAKKAL